MGLPTLTNDPAAWSGREASRNACCNNARLGGRQGLGACAISILLVTLAACGDKQESIAPLAKPRVEGKALILPAGSPQLARLKSVEVKALEVPASELTARLVWDEDRTVRVVSPLGGRVVRIHVQQGARVAAGQVLAEIASPDIGQAQADAGKAEADFALSEKNLVRVKELFEHEVAPRKDLVQAEADHARASNELARARARLRLYGGNSKVDQTLALRSPVAGTVVERSINPGQEIRTDQGGSPALFVVTDPGRLWVMIDAQERDLRHLVRGGQFSVISASQPGESFRATLDTVADFIDPQSRVIRARGSIANPDGRLKAEMLVTAVFESKGGSSVGVPPRAVVFSEGRHYAFAERGPGQFERVVVAPGAEREGMLLITSGLAAGQRVVAEGALLLQQVYRGATTKSESE